MNLPVSYTHVEGGSWFEFRDLSFTTKLVKVTRSTFLGSKTVDLHFSVIHRDSLWTLRHFHALKFSDGRVWDAINGFRPA